MCSIGHDVGLLLWTTLNLGNNYICLFFSDKIQTILNVQNKEPLRLGSDQTLLDSSRRLVFTSRNERDLSLEGWILIPSNGLENTFRFSSLYATDILSLQIYNPYSQFTSVNGNIPKDRSRKDGNFQLRTKKCR